MDLPLDIGEFSIECFSINPEHMGRLILVSAHLLKNTQDILLFHFREGQGPFSRFIDQATISTRTQNRRWKILGITVTMTFYAALERDRVWFPSAPPSAEMPPDAPSQPVVEALGRQFNAFHFGHPVLGYPLAVPASDLADGDGRAGA